MSAYRLIADTGRQWPFSAVHDAAATAAALHMMRAANIKAASVFVEGDTIWFVRLELP